MSSDSSLEIIIEMRYLYLTPECSLQTEPEHRETDLAVSKVTVGFSIVQREK